MLRDEGFKVNHKRVERLWRREGLKVPRRQPKRRRLWLNDGSCVRLRPAYRVRWRGNAVVGIDSIGNAGPFYRRARRTTSDVLSAPRALHRPVRPINWQRLRPRPGDLACASTGRSGSPGRLEP